MSERNLDTFGTFLTVLSAGKKEKPVITDIDVDTASDLEFFNVLQQNYSPQARLYGAALMELVRRLETSAEGTNESQES